MKARLPRWLVWLGSILILSMASLQVSAQDTKEAKADAQATEKTEKAERQGKSDKQEKAKPTTATVAEIILRGDYPEGSSTDSLFSQVRSSLSKVVKRLDKAATDDSVKAVLLRVEEVQLGRGKVYELRAAIGRVRKAGKPVYALLSQAETNCYLLAAACDEIVLAPPGLLILPGVRAEVTFYKGLLEKLGIQFDMMQMGKYKGAAEPLTRREMSPAMRENMETLVDGLYKNLIATLAEDRKLDKDRAAKTLDEAIYTAQSARNAGLVDQVAYRDDFLESLKKKLKVDKLDVSTKYGQEKTKTDFSGLSGFLKLMELAMGGKPATKETKQKKIAVVYAVGAIMTGKSASDIFGSQTVGSTTLVDALRSAADDSNVVAIVLRIDSPGGSAVASDLIWHEVVKIKKPIIASMGDVAASGGYYIAMGADRIFAAPNTLTGSIGVVGGKPAINGFFDKIGVNTEVISRGKNSGIFSMVHPMNAEERAVWKKMMEEIYAQFVAKAAEGRKMPREKLEELAQGRVYTGEQALEKGLVDELGTLEDAIAAAKKAAGVQPDEKLEIQVLPKPKTFLEQLLEDPSASSGVEGALPEMAKAVRETAVLRRLFAEPVLTIMPAKIEIK
jgi:protease-4